MNDTEKWRSIDMALAAISAVIVAYGVLVLGWSVFVVIALFWFENVVIGVLNVAKMLLSGARIGGAGVIAALALATFSPCITACSQSGTACLSSCCSARPNLAHRAAR